LLFDSRRHPVEKVTIGISKNKRFLMAAPKVRCTREDLNHVVDLFRTSLEEELQTVPDARIDLNKVVIEFRNLLEETCEPIASFEDDQRAQELKSEIENLQRKALRLKSNLQSRRNTFIEDVRLQTEQMLERQRPRIDPIDIEEDIEPPPEYQARLGLLDDSIEQLRAELAEAETVVQRNVAKYTEFERMAVEFFERRHL
jgi:uncharacterized small protein (DUF1192 family)